MTSQLVSWGRFLGEPVAALVRRARIEAGMTQAQVAKATGIDQSIISKYETGRREPSATALLKIVHVTGYSSRQPTAGRKSDGQSDPLLALRERVLDHLRRQGFRPTDKGILAPVETEKDKVRQLHAEAVATQRRYAEPALGRYEPRFIGQLADGAHIEPEAISPRLQLVTDRRSLEGLMWRWCSLHWSIPVSGGYGRRLRFLVRDAAHGDAVMGLIGLGDPVYGLACRDSAIGWNAEQRRRRLACVMDAFVLGAVPPYDQLLGGKLMALLAGTREVRNIFAERYGHRQTLIANRDPDAQLALITTTSALGRSSVYNRLRRPDGSLALLPVGYTQGSGDFHLSGSIYADLVALAASTVDSKAATHRHEKWTGDGFRNRREVIQRALTALGLDARALRNHGVRRQVFVSPLARNSMEWLRAGTGELDWLSADVNSLSAWWRARWAVPRARSRSSWLHVRAIDWSLYASPGTARS